MSLGRYSIVVFGIVAATLALAWPFLLRSLDVPGRSAVAFGVAIAVLNTTASHALVRWSAGRSTTAFLRAVLGGMLARMALMLAALLVGVWAVGLPRLPLALSLLAYFAGFLAMELVIQHRQPATAVGTAR